MLLLISVFVCMFSSVTSYVAYSVCDRWTDRGLCESPRPMGLPGVLRVAAGQITSNKTDTLEGNVQKIAKWIGLAAKEGARVILFPELSATGYITSCVSSLAGPEGKASVANARLRAAEAVISAACKKNNIYAIVGIPVFWGDINETNPRPWYNTALVFDPFGDKIYRQAKFYSAGTIDGTQGEWLDIFHINNTDGTVIPVATLICFDDFHPEIPRLQAMAGAQVLFYMSSESDVMFEWKLSLTGAGSAQGVAESNSAINQVFTVQANTGDSVDNIITNNGGSHGQSRIIDPSGTVLETARVFGEELLIHDLDLALCFPQNQRMVMAGLWQKIFKAMWAEGMKVLGHRMKIDW